MSFISRNRERANRAIYRIGKDGILHGVDDMTDPTRDGIKSWAIPLALALVIVAAFFVFDWQAILSLAAHDLALFRAEL